jgi:hypothetical protein
VYSDSRNRKHLASNQVIHASARLYFPYRDRHRCFDERCGRAVVRRHAQEDLRHSDTDAAPEGGAEKEIADPNSNAFEKIFTSSQGGVNHSIGFAVTEEKTFACWRRVAGPITECFSKKETNARGGSITNGVPHNFAAPKEKSFANAKSHRKSLANASSEWLLTSQEGFTQSYRIRISVAHAVGIAIVNSGEKTTRPKRHAFAESDQGLRELSAQGPETPYLGTRADHAESRL